MRGVGGEGRGWWWAGKMLYGADLSVCVCVSCLYMKVSLISAPPLTLEERLRGGW